MKKLYVWENALRDYTSGVIFTLAESLEEARKNVLADTDYRSVREDISTDPLVIDPETDNYTNLTWGGG